MVSDGKAVQIVKQHTVVDSHAREVSRRYDKPRRVKIKDEPKNIKTTDEATESPDGTPRNITVSAPQPKKQSDGIMAFAIIAFAGLFVLHPQAITIVADTFVSTLNTITRGK